MTKVLGLTGSIATGKSTIAKLFKQENIPIVDADLISRQVVEPGAEAYQKIVSIFGQDILSPDQTINRKKFGQIIFDNREKREQLNAIIHPIIIAQLIKERDQLISENHRIIILDIPLLFELKLTDLMDKVIVVYASPEKQLKRLKRRDHLSEQDAKQRISSQISIEDKVKEADYLIDNDGTEQETKEQFYQLLEQLKQNDCQGEKA